ncbi:MAG TPA: hypothetical protein DCW31_08790 [Lactobacillus sp.]|nr:hypothetical protein [Lactobacillus sp.]
MKQIKAKTPTRNRGLVWLISGVVAVIVVVIIAVGGTVLYKNFTTTNYELVDAAQPMTYQGKKVTAHGVASFSHKQATVTSMSFGQQAVVVTVAHYQFDSSNKKTAKPSSIALAIYQFPRKQFEQTYAKQLSSNKQNNVVAINSTLKTVKPQAGVYIDQLSQSDKQRLNIDTTSSKATYQELEKTYASASRKVATHTHFTPIKRVYQQAHKLGPSQTKQYSRLADAVKYMQEKTVQR